MATAHIQAEFGEIAKTVLMPGDPLRARHLVENYLENPVQFNSVRNMFGYTGTYKGTKISIMGSGMGMPSIGIYSYELYSQYGVENIIRIGSAGSYVKEVKVYDVVLADSAYSQSSYARIQSGYDKDKTYPSEKLNAEIIKKAQELQLPVNQSCVHSSDVFYVEGGTDYKRLAEEHGCTCVEMESFALFHNAKVLGKNAACLLTISDSFITKEEISAEARQTSFDKMMKLALETAAGI
ncbi:MAG: purine-nucleoside phosphorylase [Flavobacteriaceae bacterium]|jgi:purine-nucleoside phosphorylase|nr:purine-nucleoside phosphorylase [Flavobacteriaceae bacterium]